MNKDIELIQEQADGSLKGVRVAPASGQCLAFDANLDPTTTPPTAGGVVQGTDGNARNLRATDEGITPGSPRGEHSVDLQTVRTEGTQAATGTGATIGGGRFNTAQGGCAVVAGGESNTVTGGCGAIPGGQANAVSGPFGLAGGEGCTAGNWAALAFGSLCGAYAGRSVALGREALVETGADLGVAVGDHAVVRAAAPHAHAFGKDANAAIPYSHVECSGNAVNRAAQRIDVSLLRITSEGNELAVRLDNLAEYLRIPANTAWLVHLRVLAVSDAGHLSVWALDFAAQNNGVEIAVSDIHDNKGTVWLWNDEVLCQIVGENSGAYVRLTKTFNSSADAGIGVNVCAPAEPLDNTETQWHCDLHVTQLAYSAGGGTGSAG